MALLDFIDIQGILLSLSNEFEHHPYRSILDCLLVFFIFYVLFKKEYTVRRQSQERLTKKEEEELIEEWKSDPLVPSDRMSRLKTKEALNSMVKYVQSGGSATQQVNGNEKLNFAGYNFLGLSTNSTIVKKAHAAIDKFGVGACGPRGFYGSQMPHIDLEKKCFEFLKKPDAILYSYGFATISSVIPAFSKRGDLIVIDEGCSYPLQHGAELARSVVKRFKHNDMNDLERILKEVSTGKMREKFKNQARTIVIEGVYPNTGTIANLKKIVELSKKYKVKIILDDSFGVGVLGRTGRGTIEHCGCVSDDFALIVFNLENALGGVGGMCLGTKTAMRHQRLLGLGYTYSASVPPFTCVAAIEGITMIEKDPSIIKQLQENITYARHVFSSLNPQFELKHDSGSPILHLRLKYTELEFEDETAYLSDISSRCLEMGLSTVVPRYSPKEWANVKPSIRLTVNVNHTQQDIDTAGNILKKAIDSVQ